MPQEIGIINGLAHAKTTFCAAAVHCVEPGSTSTCPTQLVFFCGNQPQLGVGACERRFRSVFRNLQALKPTGPSIRAQNCKKQWIGQRFPGQLQLVALPSCYCWYVERLAFRLSPCVPINAFLVPVETYLPGVFPPPIEVSRPIDCEVYQRLCGIPWLER